MRLPDNVLLLFYTLARVARYYVTTRSSLGAFIYNISVTHLQAERIPKKVSYIVIRNAWHMANKLKNWYLTNVIFAEQ